MLTSQNELGMSGGRWDRSGLFTPSLLNKCLMHNYAALLTSRVPLRYSIVLVLLGCFWQENKARQGEIDLSVPNTTPLTS